MKRRIISLIIALMLSLNMFTIMPSNAFAANEESHTYEKDGYTVTYKIGSEWENNRTVEVNIKNTGEDSILNWALKYDVGGEMSNLWNAKLYDKGEDYVIIKNNGYNYEIEPEQSVSCGYIVTGKETVIPEDIELCSRRIDVSVGYDVDFNITSDWHTGFQAEVTIENTSTEPIEAWTLLFDGNFTINTIWNAKLLSSENGKYEVANQLWTTPIKAGESASFGFTADKSATENAKAENFQLTAVVIGESVLEKEPVIDYELDTDEDGLPDYYEDILGTDKNKADTDGDGLSDGYEVLYLGTDPLKVDSDDNGINDGDEDFDKDGLTNEKECELGTDPNTSDTDGDGLNDNDELNIHKTDPLKYDTDGDKVSDGDEVELGLNPLNPATNGYPDNEYTTEQSLEDNSTSLDYINTVENNPYTVAVDLTAAGIVDNNLSVIDSRYSSVIKNSAIIGVAPEFVYTDGLSVKEATIKFKIDNSVINNTLGTYAEHNDELKGIKRLNIFTFVEGINMLLPVETFYDETTNTVYTKTDQMGTYCLMDIEILFQNLGIEPSEDNVSDVSEATFESVLDNEINLMYNVNTTNVRTSNTRYRNDFDLVFIIDEVNNTNEELNSINKKIFDLSEEIWERSPDTTITIIEIYGSAAVNGISFEKQNKEDLNDLLKAITSKESSGYLDISRAVDYIADKYENENVYCVAFFDSNANFYSETYVDGKANSALTTLYNIEHNAKDNINISVVSNFDEGENEAAVFSMTYENTDEAALNKGENKITYFSMMYESTGGLTFGKGVSDEDFSNDMLNHIYKSPKEEIQIISSAGLTTLPSDFGIISKTSEQDYDKDGLLDVEEIYFDVKDKNGQNLVTINDDGILILPSFNKCVAAGDTYVRDGLEKFRKKIGEQSSHQLDNFGVLPIHSAPVDADSDNDGIIDKYDKNPLKYCENDDDIKNNYDNAFVTFKLDTPDKKVTIMGSTIPLKALPDWNSKTLKSIKGVNGKDGKKFEVEYVTITSNDSWVRIYYNGVYGYVHNSYVRVDDNNDTLLKIMFSETPCIDGISFIPEWQNTDKSIEVKSKNRVVDTSKSPIERQNIFEKIDVSKLAISQSELGFLYVVSKEMGDVSDINKTTNLIRKSNNMPEINNGMFEWMLAISMHESTFGNCISPYTWKETGATGYFQCTHWPQDDFEDMYNDKDKLSIRWSNLSMRLDKSDNDICNRKCYYGTIVIGCHCLRNSVKYSNAYETNTAEKFREKTFQYYADSKGGSKNGYNASEFIDLIDEVINIYEKSRIYLAIQLFKKNIPDSLEINVNYFFIRLTFISLAYDNFINQIKKHILI